MTQIPPDIPAYAYIKRELKTQIESGDLPEGERVPSELELARIYGVSRNPTRQALRDLELEGYIVRSPGRGSFVAPRSKRQKLFQVDGWRTMAIACPELECHYTRGVVQKFIRVAAERGFHTMVYFMRLRNEEEVEFLADMRNSGIEGIALWLQHASERTLDLLRRFRRSNYPFVLIDRYVRGIEADFVVTNNDDAAFQLTTALVRRGHRDIAFITSELDNTSAEDRFSGYRRALKEARLPFNVELMGVFDAEGEPVQNVVSRILAHRKRPTAFFCGNDGVGGKLLDVLNELGYEVPSDVEIATIDDNQLADASGVPMITATQAAEDMGYQSADLLMTRIENPEQPLQQRFLKAVLEGMSEMEPPQSETTAERRWVTGGTSD
jgi:DNA-binding LacI/PurR family transcriptional regulator